MYRAIFTLLLIKSVMCTNAQTTYYRMDDPDMMGCVFVDTFGNESAVGLHDKLRIGEKFSEGLVCIDFKENVLDDDAWGCMNEKGDTVIRGKYLEPFYFSDGIAKVSTAPMPRDENSEDYEINYYCQYINKQGMLISDKLFESNASTQVTNNWAVTKSGKQWYILSKNGKLKELSVDYETVYPFSDGLAKCKRMNTYTSYIDTTGWPVLEIPNENFTGNFINGYAAYSIIKDQYGFIDKKGKPICPCLYDAVSMFSKKLAGVKIYNKWGFIDEKGKIVIAPAYEGATGFTEGLARVKLKEKYGFIDKAGKIVILIKFKHVLSFKNGLAAACDEKDRWGYINKKGQWVIKPQFISAETFDTYGFATVLYADEYSEINDPLERFEKALISKRGKVIWYSGEKPVIK